jgi:hypothetical protein
VSRRARTRSFVVAGLLVSLVLAGLLSWYASSSPDGLERVAQDHGLSQTTGEHAAADSPLADYGTRGVDDERLSGGLAGVIGVAATGAVMGGLVLLLRRRSGRREATDLPDADR